MSNELYTNKQKQKQKKLASPNQQVIIQVDEDISRKVLKVDQLPSHLINRFLKEIEREGQFYRDMFTVSNDLGLRNVEARTLTAAMYDAEAQTLTLLGSKQQLAHRTKRYKALLDAAWLKEGCNLMEGWLAAKGASEFEIAGLLVKIETPAELERLCARYKVDFSEEFAAFEKTVKPQLQLKAREKQPKARVIDLKPFPMSRLILDRRCSKYTGLGGYLFPACELESNRAKGQGFEPITRQTVKRLIDKVHRRLVESSEKIKKALTGIRLGLSSFRKVAVQRIEKKHGLEFASQWIGHSSIAITSNYLDRSIQSLEKKLSSIESPKYDKSFLSAFETVDVKGNLEKPLIEMVVV